MTDTYRLTLPWTRPPLSANQRLLWPERHRLTREVRTTVGWLAKAAQIPPADHVTVTLVWTPGVRRERDEDNPFPTLKAACDGLVDAGIVRDDTPAWMDKRMPVITGPGRAGLWLDVEITRPRTKAVVTVEIPPLAPGRAAAPPLSPKWRQLEPSDE